MLIRSNRTVPHTTTSPKKKSPLRSEPQALPGDSIRRQIIQLIFPAFYYIFALGGVLGLLIGAWLVRIGIPALWMTLIVGLIEAPLLFAFWRYMRQADKKLDNLVLGKSGEIAVAEQLNQLIGDGYQILHDLKHDPRNENSANIDHVAIGPSDIFVIETKTRSKGEQHEIVFDGERLTMNGRVINEGAVGQTFMNARRIAEIIREQTGRDIRPQPVLVFAGKWFIDDQRPPGTRDSIWVLNDKTLISWIRRQQLTLMPEDVALYAARLRSTAI